MKPWCIRKKKGVLELKLSKKLHEEGPVYKKSCSYIFHRVHRKTLVLKSFDVVLGCNFLKEGPVTKLFPYKICRTLQNRFIAELLRTMFSVYVKRHYSQ